MKFVNVYDVDRRYGGPEEGGWWFNNYTCIETYPTREENAEEIVDFLENEYEGREYGDIYSVLGGREIQVLIESRPAESETKVKPQYE